MNKINVLIKSQPNLLGEQNCDFQTSQQVRTMVANAAQLHNWHPITKLAKSSKAGQIIFVFTDKVVAVDEQFRQSLALFVCRKSHCSSYKDFRTSFVHFVVKTLQILNKVNCEDYLDFKCRNCQCNGISLYQAYKKVALAEAVTVEAAIANPCAEGVGMFTAHYKVKLVREREHKKQDVRLAVSAIMNRFRFGKLMDSGSPDQLVFKVVSGGTSTLGLFGHFFSTVAAAIPSLAIG